MLNIFNFTLLSIFMYSHKFYIFISLFYYYYINPHIYFLLITHFLYIQILCTPNLYIIYIHIFKLFQKFIPLPFYSNYIYYTIILLFFSSNQSFYLFLTSKKYCHLTFQYFFLLIYLFLA